MSNPNQQAPAEKLSLGEAVRAIAERTAFRTEAERDAVLATLDEHIKAENEPDPEPEDTADPEPEPEPVKTPARRGGK